MTKYRLIASTNGAYRVQKKMKIWEKFINYALMDFNSWHTIQEYRPGNYSSLNDYITDSREAYKKALAHFEQIKLQHEKELKRRKLTTKEKWRVVEELAND